MKLKAIDFYCQEHKLKRSNLLVNATLSYINSKGKVKCDFCSNASQGKYQMQIYDWEAGEQDVTKNLCSFHYEKAKKEGVVIKDV